MPEKETLERAEKDREEGKAPSTQAGEFVREEMHHVREGKHGARSTKQAIAIGLSKARRSGVPLKPPRGGKKSTRESAERAYSAGQSGRGRRPSATRSRAVYGRAGGEAAAVYRPSAVRLPSRMTAISSSSASVTTKGGASRTTSPS